MTTPVNTAAPLTPRLHPLMATAAIAVTTFSLAGIAAMSGLLPMTKAATAEAPVAIEKPAQTAPAVQTVQAMAETPVAKPLPKPAAKPAAKVAAPVTPPAELAQAAPLTKAPQAVHDQAAPETPPAAMPQPVPIAAAPARCLQCGVIDNVREVAQPGEGSGLGAVIGGVLGGVLGNQVGGGTGNKIATVLGAAGGAYAGHQYEKNRNQTTRYEISVRMQDGSLRSVMQDSLPAWRIGDRVRIDNNVLLAN